jgi:hypothetical protein
MAIQSRLKELSLAWSQRRISNFEYLMDLNNLAGSVAPRPRPFSILFRC